MSTELNFFTAEYPYGKHETFIENEIDFAAKEFTKIRIYPYHKVDGLRHTPLNVEIKDRFKGKRRNVLFRHFFLILNILFTEFYNTRSKFFFLKKLPLWLSYVKKAIIDAETIYVRTKDSPNEQYYYSYWMNDWALSLAILKKQKKIGGFVFRCGGFDIWNERHEGNYLPFRYFIYKHTSAVYPNSKMGETYLKKLNYYAEKITVAYWGTPDFGLSLLPQDDTTLVLVSCSSLIPLKRVELIAKSLLEVKRKVKWVHFGDGVMASQIKAIAATLPANIQVNFMGNVTNRKVHEFYKNNPVDFFITTSSTESFPVSIQEAISYGLPVIATNVGGILEMVNEETGFLVKSTIIANELTLLFEGIKLNEWRNELKRQQIRDFWQRQFNAESVYPVFFRKMKNGK